MRKQALLVSMLKLSHTWSQVAILHGEGAVLDAKDMVPSLGCQ